MKCQFCGTPLRPEQPKCPSCGKAVPNPQADQAESGSESPSQTELLQELLRHKPSSLAAGARLVMMLIFGLMFIGLVIFFFVVSGRRGDAPPIFQIFAVIFGLGGLAMTVGGVYGFLKLSRSPLQRLPAVVVGKRQKTAPRSSPENTVYFLTIEIEGGHRKEHSVSETVFGSVEEGDTGVAYIKGGYLLDFKPVPIPRT